ncbi:autotransporter domain protein [Campylobacter iguaniorum]|uniref:autotransporter outer membrane beta-barrel domain-containing protein n=1 Tax=Campylobacter iguaniorum TaxID=1244531 RepID=UPI00073A22EE|nr:autotransporter outer membrane beta-barrel domain-containing protein [Campylobacter iguaniorum]ALV24245.1 autotransporter domain protein [Campylobacter iguaniorum]
MRSKMNLQYTKIMFSIPCVLLMSCSNINATGFLTQNVYNDDVDFTFNNADLIQTYATETYQFNKNLSVTTTGGQQVVYAMEGSDLTFNIAQDKTFSINGYKNGNILRSSSNNSANPATFNINGGHLFIDQTSFNKDIGGLYTDNNGYININNQSITINNVGNAIELKDQSKFNITTGNIEITNAYRGIAMQSNVGGYTAPNILNLNSANNISIEAMQTNGAGIYALAYTGLVPPNVITLKANNDIKIDSAAQGIASFGKNEISLEAKNIDIDGGTRAIYSRGYENLDSLVTLKANNSINLTSNDTGVYSYRNSTVNLNASDITINATKYAIYSNAIADTATSLVNLNANSIKLGSSDNYVVYSANDGSVVSLNAKDVNINAVWSLFADNSGKINITSDISNINITNDALRAYNSSDITINTNTNILNSGVNAIRTNTNGKVTINAPINQIKGDMYSAGGGEIRTAFSSNESKFTGSTDITTGGIIDLAFSNDATWYNTDDSTLSHLRLNKGIVDMSHTSGGQDLVVATDFSGSDGVFVLDISPDDINHGGTQTDFISIASALAPASAEIRISSSSIPSLSEYDFSGSNKAIWFGDVHNNVTFTSVQSKSMDDVYDYVFQTDINVRGGGSVNGNNWFLVGYGKRQNEAANSIINDSILRYLDISTLELDSLHKRLGEIQNYDEKDGIWARIIGAKGEYNDANINFNNKYNMIQAGYDKRYDNDYGDFFSGFALSYKDNDMDYKFGKGDSKNIGLALYESYFNEDKYYIDFILKYNHIRNKFEAFNDIGQTMQAKYNTNMANISLELGRKLQNEDRYFITPLGQINYGYIRGVDYTTSTGIKVEQDNINSLIGKLGLYAGKDFEQSSHYFKFGVLKEFIDEYGVYMQGKKESLHKTINIDDNWYEVGIGGDIWLNDDKSKTIYYSLEKTFGGRYETKWQATAGFRYLF